MPCRAPSQGVLSLAMLGLFLAATFAILVTPGPDVLYVLARSIGQGRRAGVLSVLGVSLGILVHTVLAAFGLAKLFEAYPVAFDVVRIAGVVYLGYLAVRAALARVEPVIAGVATPVSAPKVVGQAFLTNLLNPKATLFFVAFLPQFADGGAGGLFQQLLLLGLVVVLMATAVNLAYALLADRIAARLRRSPKAEKVGKWVSASVLAGLAARLALA